MDASGAVITAVGATFDDGDIGCLIADDGDCSGSGRGLSAGAATLITGAVHVGVIFLYFCERSAFFLYSSAILVNGCVVALSLSSS